MASNTKTDHFQIPKPNPLNPLEWDVNILVQAINIIDAALYQINRDTNQRITDLIGAAPEAVNSIHELARAINNDPQFFNNLPSKFVERANGNMLGAFNEAAPKIVPVAQNLNLAEHASNSLYLTGSGEIHSLGEVPSGAKRTLLFMNPVTLKNSTNFVLPDNQDIVTKIGDNIEVMSLGNGVWQCLRYTRVGNNLTPQSDLIKRLQGIQSAHELISFLKTGSFWELHDEQTLMAGITYNASTRNGPKTVYLPDFNNCWVGQEIGLCNTDLSWGEHRLYVDHKGNTIINNQSEGLECDSDLPLIRFICARKDAGTVYWTVSV